MPSAGPPKIRILRFTGGNSKKHTPKAEFPSARRRTPTSGRRTAPSAKGPDGVGAQLLEPLMRHRDDDPVIGARFRLVRSAPAHIRAALRPGPPRGRARRRCTEILELADNVDHPGVAQVGAVFLESQSHDRTRAPSMWIRRLISALTSWPRDIGAHAVVDAGGRPG